VKIDSTIIPKRVEIAKVLPICFRPIKKNGRFKTKIKIPRGKVVICESIIDIPVIPPSITLFGTKKISKPTAIRIAPIDIAIALWMTFSLDIGLCMVLDCSC
jgi:hypothetical protein